jgi:hypothetical protein
MALIKPTQYTAGYRQLPMLSCVFVGFPELLLPPSCVLDPSADSPDGLALVTAVASVVDEARPDAVL